MLWLDEDVRSDAQTASQGRAKRELGVPIDGHGVQHHALEGVRIDGKDSGAISGKIGAYTVPKRPYCRYRP